MSADLVAAPRGRVSERRQAPAAASGFAHDFAQVNVFPPAARGYAVDPEVPEEEVAYEAEPGAFLGQTPPAPAPPTPAPPAPTREPAPPAAPTGPGTEPAPPAATPPAPACVITSATRVPAPDGTADTRTTVGVHEVVEFTTGTTANWTASAGTPAATAAKDPFVWTAPDSAAATVTITASSGTPATTCTITMTVVEPSGMTFAKQSEDTFAAGTQGAGMWCNVDVTPLSVSFANVEWLEVPGPATNVRGYWKEKQDKGADLSHHPNPKWIRLNSLNRARDHASSFNWPSPWKDGGFEWSIPNRFRVVGNTGIGKRFAMTLQTFSIVKNGTTTVGKETESVTRTP